uniref:Phosphoinositide phospholipase C n=1 Tax=Neospora caninum (strain Liverpool) TaxID=572307 RepID=A0A0F7UL17_NEOCL|nr:TPA: Phospholipid phospholipase C beta isoform,related [Neospora caninum Liverpool]
MDGGVERQASSSSSRASFLSAPLRFSKKHEASPHVEHPEAPAKMETDAAEGRETLLSRPPTASTGGSSEAVSPTHAKEKPRRLSSFGFPKKASPADDGDRSAALFAPPSAAREGGAVVSQRIKELLADVDTREALEKLAEGSFLLKWCKTNFKKPHERFFYVDANAMALKWKSPKKQESFTTIPVGDVQRIIPGEDTDFGRNKADKTLSIEIVASGRVLHVACRDETEWKLWMKGLLLYHDMALGQLASEGASDFISVQWHTAEKDSGGKIEQRHLHCLLRKLNIQADSRYVEELFQKHDTENSGRLGFSEFREMLNELLIRPDVDYYFAVYKVPQEDFIDEQGYRRFLQEVQKATSEAEIEEELANFRSVDEAFRKPGPTGMLSALGFGSLLCSEANSLMAPHRLKVHQDMSLPLCNYWVKSSHNTYLCGDQVVGKSAVGQYIDVLLRGCRCVELDCWDGSDGEPSLFHGVGGYQLTSRIKFKDVIQACRDYGFQRSKFPIILSLEMHCSAKQRIRIAEILDEILQDQIYRCSSTSPQPSPEQLMCKFILKGKVPNERGEMVEEGDEEDLQLDELELEMAKSLDLLGDGRDVHSLEALSSSFLHALEGQGTSLSLPETPPSPVQALSQLSSLSLGNEALDGAPQSAPSGEGDASAPSLPAGREDMRAVSDPKANRLASPSSKGASGSCMRRNRNPFLRKSSSFTCASAARTESFDQRGVDAPRRISEEAEDDADAAAREDRDGPPAPVEWRRARTVDRLNEAESREEKRATASFGDAEADSAFVKTAKRSKGNTATPGAASADSKSERLKVYYRNIAMPGKKLRSFEQPRNPMDICSMPESRLLKLVKQSPLEFARFNQKYLTRVYPAGTRLSSSNFNPVIPWLFGAQVVALNLQSLGSATILNEGRFLDNGGSAGGYVLKPAMMRNPRHPFVPAFAEHSSGPETPVHFTLKILSAHQLPRPVAEAWKGPSTINKIKTRKNTDLSCPFVSVSVHGVKEDTKAFRTPTVMNNGFNPRWSSPEATFEFLVRAPSVALLMFKVQTADSVRSEFLAAACFPLDAIRQGVRWVPLFDRKFCRLRWTGLLVYCRVVPLERDDATNTWNPVIPFQDEGTPPPPGPMV